MTELMKFPLLSWTIWLPVVSGVVLWSLSARISVGLARGFSILTTLATLFLCLLLYRQFDTSSAELQWVEHTSWIPQLAIEYALGIDGLSLLFIFLTAVMTPLALLIRAPFQGVSHVRFLSNFLILEGLMIGVFAAQDGILYYLFWEAMLVPMFLIIGIWGGEQRIYATIKFFLYTLLGSLLMLVAMLYLYGLSGSFALSEWYRLPLSLMQQQWLFLAFLAAFAVKIPMFPVHTWLPDAHTEAPTAGSVILAAIMLKMGAYGLLRFNLPIFPDASQEFALWMIVISLIAIVYIAWVALVQEDIKRLIAYSSISHMGFVTLGIFLLTDGGMSGGIVQMISHGFTSGALFICAGVVYDRLHTRKISEIQGVANVMPRYAMFFVLFAMANAGLPGTSGFVGEFLVIVSAFEKQAWIAGLAATTLVFGAAYSLWLTRRTVFGEAVSEAVASMKDMVLEERLVLWILAFAVVFFGVYPALLLEILDPYVEQLLQQVHRSKIGGL